MVECLCGFYSALSHHRRVFNKFKIRWFWLALLVSVYLNLLHRAMFGSNQHKSRYPFSYRFPNDITSVYSLVFSIIMCILSLWVSSLFWGKSRVVMREWNARGGARASNFVAARLLPRVLSRSSPCLPLDMESLFSGFCILGIFLSTFPMTFMRRMCHLLMIIVFLKTLILNKSLFLIMKWNLLDMHNKGTGPSVYTIVLSYNNSVIKESFDFTWIWVVFIVLFNPVFMIRSDSFCWHYN